MLACSVDMYLFVNKQTESAMFARIEGLNVYSHPLLHSMVSPFLVPGNIPFVVCMFGRWHQFKLATDSAPSETTETLFADLEFELSVCPISEAI